MAPPSATFEDPAAIAAAASLRYSPEKLFLGLIDARIDRADGTGERYAIGGAAIGVADDRHAITIAGSRAGKGRAAIIPNMLLYAGSVLAIDPKGELAVATAAVRAKKIGQRVCVLDPFGTTGDAVKAFRTGFNPIAMMRPASLVEDAGLIADALVIPGGSGTDPHWDESARTFIEGVILEVATAERFEGRRDLVTVRDLIAQGDVLPDDSPADDDETEIERGLRVLEAFMMGSSEPAVRRAAADFFEKPDRERGSVLSSARRHLRALAFPEIEGSLRGQGFDLADLKKQPMSIYLCLPGRHMGTCGRWLRLFINLALQAMERTPGPPAAGDQVLFVLDEFSALGHMRQIEDSIAQVAGYPSFVKLWPILQDLGQLKSLYKDRWETFMGNAGVLQFFGNNDLTTLEWVSKRIGSTTIEQLSGSAVTPGGKGGGAVEGYAPRTTKVLEPEEVALVFGRSDPQLRQLVIRAGFAPMVLQRAYHDKHEMFRGK